MATDAEKHVWEDDDGNLVVALDLADAPGGVREYVVNDVSAGTGRWVHRLTDKAKEAQARLDAGEDAEAVDADLHLSDDAEDDLYEKLLGSTYDDLVDDEVPHRKAMLVGQLAYAWVLRGLEGARKVWEADGAPKPNREQRRAAAKSRASGSKSSASGASASTTRPRASTSRTKTRK